MYIYDIKYSVDNNTVITLWSVWLATANQTKLLFVGSTEFEILQNLEDIAEQALPLEKQKKLYTDLNTAKNLIINRVTFC